MRNLGCMAFAVDFDDEGIEKIIADYAGTNIGCLIASDCNCSPASAEKLKNSLTYHSISISGSRVPGEDLIPLFPEAAKEITIKQVIFNCNPSPFENHVHSLVTLDYSFTNLDDRALEPFDQSTLLQTVRCDSTNSTIRSVGIANSMPNLKVFCISDCGVSMLDVADIQPPIQFDLCL